MIGDRQYILDRIKAEERGHKSPCWTWQMSKRGYGYGQSTVRHAKGGNVSAHRVAYAAFRGPIPEGLCLDHLCHNRDCCNPDHLEAVTQAENTRRGNARRYANGGYAQPCSIPRAKTRPRSEELKVLGDTLASFKAEKLLTIAEIGAVMGRSVQMVRLYFIGESEPGVFAWRRAVAKWPELNDRLIFNLDEAEKAFCARQRTFNLRLPEERVA